MSSRGRWDRSVTRRAFLGTAAAAGLAGCASFAARPTARATPPAGTTPPSPAPPPAPPAPATPAVRLVGDGSTSDTGPQPHQPVPERLVPGQAPPQFVVLSWDGAANLSTGLFPRFRALAAETGAAMTFFLSGIYALPAGQRMQYAPPQHPVGASDIGFLSTDEVVATMREIGAAWLDGHEIGTHFNGHFCGADGVGRWSPADWASEIEQAKRFVQTWKTNTGLAGRPDVPALPFDYDVELIGGRTPCLEGQEALLPTAAGLGWRYDASSPGGQQIWPTQRQGLWDLPLQALPFPDAVAGKSRHVLSMDYNLMYKQSNGDMHGDPAMYPTWRAQARNAYLAGFDRAYGSNRAPLFIGNHFEQWNGGIYMDAVEDTVRAIAGRPDVRLVSFRQLVAWLDAQDPAVLAKLRTLTPGTAPPGGWSSFLA
ncbi:hypothetical protein [Modestobacter sp. NPDC049651]|uniref:hypothetical protein n=1 Tax=unclassified Modestobacter TaxID=2643866 RepID=UPI0033C9140E